MRFGELIKNWRIIEKRNLRDVAKEIGIGSSTLCRIENGEMMDGAALVKVLTWATANVN